MCRCRLGVLGGGRSVFGNLLWTRLRLGVVDAIDGVGLIGSVEGVYSFRLWLLVDGWNFDSWLRDFVGLIRNAGIIIVTSRLSKGVLFGLDSNSAATDDAADTGTDLSNSRSDSGSDSSSDSGSEVDAVAISFTEDRETGFALIVLLAFGIIVGVLSRYSVRNAVSVLVNVGTNLTDERVLFRLDADSATTDDAANAGSDLSDTSSDSCSNSDAGSGTDVDTIAVSFSE